MRIGDWISDVCSSDLFRRESPLVLTVPGLNNSGPGHWQTIWETTRNDCERVDLGMWDRPHRNTWANKLNAAIRKADRPVILVAHSLGCIAGSEVHPSALQSLMRISYAVFCLKKTNH